VAQQDREAGRERDDAGVLAGSGGLAQAGEQAGALGPGPGQGLLAVGQGGNRGWYRAGRGRGAGLAGEKGVGEAGGEMVIIQQPGGGLVPVSVWVKPIGESPGVLADQVVHPVPAPGRLGEQVVVIQGLQAAAGNGEAGAAQGGGIAVDVRARMQPEPPEQPPAARDEILIRQVERRGDRPPWRPRSAGKDPRMGPL
jgi:hypothetical protein